MPGYTNSQDSRRHVAPNARTSRYRTLYPLFDSSLRRQSPTGKQDTFAQRIRALTSSSTTSGTKVKADTPNSEVPGQAASALAGWGIPSEGWIQYHNGKYLWPDEIVMQDSPTLGLDQPLISTADLTDFESRAATGVLQRKGAQRLASLASSSFNGRKQIRRAPVIHASSLRDQYSIVSPHQPIDQSSSSGSSTEPTSESESEKYLPHGFVDTNPSCDNLIDLIAIVRHIVPAGGLNPNMNYGVFERLKYTSNDTDEGVQNFVRSAEAEDPDFLDKLTDFAGGRPGVFKGASPSATFHRQDMLDWGYVCYEGEWIKGEEAEKRRKEAEGQARQTLQAQALRLNSYQRHPAQLEDELAYEVDYGYTDLEDELARGFASDLEEDLRQSRSTKGGIFKRGAGKKLFGTGMIRRGSSASGKSKRDTKQQKMDRGTKADTRRSRFDLF